MANPGIADCPGLTELRLLITHIIKTGVGRFFIGVIKNRRQPTQFVAPRNDLFGHKDETGLLYDIRKVIAIPSSSAHE